MKPEQMILRCYAEKQESVWVAVCIDLCLAAQGDSFPDAKARLQAQIKDHLRSCMDGDDREYAGQFYARKAPLQQILRYHYYGALCHLRMLRDGAKAKLFSDTLPLQLAA